jgi:sugar phosphate isomerase/epimerase
MPAPFDPARLLEVLDRHDVEYVLIGGLAGALHGSPAATNDADICPARTPDNLSRLAAALVVLEARIRTESEPDGPAFDRSPEFLAVVELLNTTTAAGDLDISFVPTGTGGYNDLAERAVAFEIGDTRVLVASLDDVIHSKRTAGRPKDLATLPVLEALRDELGDSTR